MRVATNKNVPFVLDESKLHRIHTVIEEQFSAVGFDQITQYTVQLKSGKTIRVNDLEHLLAMDNLVRNPIVSLDILATTLNQEGQAQPTPIEVPAQDKHHCSLMFTRPPLSSIRLECFAPEPVWVHGTFAALEEQTERTVQKGLLARMRTAEGAMIAMLSLAMLLTVLFSVIRTAIRPDLTKQMYLTNEDIAELMAIDETSLPREITRRQLFNLSKPQKEADKILRDWRFYAVASPIVITLGCFVLLVCTCYPPYVFKWGDVGEWHNSILRRRRTLWITVILGSFLGILSNLAVFGLVGLSGL